MCWKLGGHTSAIVFSATVFFVRYHDEMDQTEHSHSFSSERILALGLVTRMASCWARSTRVFLQPQGRK
jgi:hypothetical protein